MGLYCSGGKVTVSFNFHIFRILVMDQLTQVISKLEKQDREIENIKETLVDIKARI